MSAGRVASIHARLLNLAKENGEDFNLVLNRYGLERWLYRLSISEARERLWLKGALLFALWGAALAIVLAFGHENRDAFMWAGLLVVQSLPYLAALITSLINAFPDLHFGHNQPVTADAGD